MADQVNLLSPTIQVATDPINGFLYIVKDSIDYRISYGDLVQFLSNNAVIRAEGGVAVIGGVNIITFSTPFESDNIGVFIYDYQGIGIQLDSWTDENFTITALGNGNINYIAISNI